MDFRYQLDQNEVISVCMPQVPGYKYCVVETFTKYISYLIPLIPDVWPYPQDDKKCEDTTVWNRNRITGPSTVFQKNSFSPK